VFVFFNAYLGKRRKIQKSKVQKSNLKLKNFTLENPHAFDAARQSRERTTSLRDALKHFAVFKLMGLFLFSVYKQ